jgi:hypothetical protein
VIEDEADIRTLPHQRDRAGQLAVEDAEVETQPMSRQQLDAPNKIRPQTKAIIGLGLD